MPTTWTIALAEDSLLPGLLFAGGILLAVVILMRHWRRTAVRRKTRPEQSPRERIDEIHARAMAGREGVEELMSDAEQLTRRLAATLDNKAARLELLVVRAERALARLEGEHGSTALPERELSAAERQVWFTSAPPERAASGEHDAVYRLADAGRSAADIARELGKPVGQVELILNLRRRQSG